MSNRAGERCNRPCMNARHAAVAIALASLLCASRGWAAQGEERRGSVPPGTSQDGSGPSAGAIKGGSIESKDTADPDSKRQPDVARCRDLTGTLRTQCIADARNKDAGGPASK